MIELKGKRFGRLIVINRSKPNGWWDCVCDCGNSKSIRGSSLRHGLTKSCGCFRRQCGHERVTGVMNQRKHGMYNSPEYRVWHGMNSRCNNPKAKDWHRYGGRGIHVDSRWRDFAAFFDDMGRRPSPNHSLERCDNEGPYARSNCKWATRKEQQRNRSGNHLVTLAGRTQALSAWAEELGLSWSCLNNRIRRGWAESKILIRARTRARTYQPVRSASESRSRTA